MSLLLSEIHIGRPLRFGALTLFPLFSEGNRPCEYLLADEGIAAGTVTVDEVTQEGRVPELVVENRGPQRLLLLEGEELHGCRQNRVVNTTLLVPARSRLTIPVSCSEQRRWRRTSSVFAAAKTISPVRVRSTLKGSVHESLKEKRGHRADQGKVWDDVSKQADAVGASSRTGAQADTYAQCEAQRAEAQKALQYVPGACGLAVALGPQVVSADLFDQPATCEKLWGRLLSGLVLDLLADGGRAQAAPDVTQVRQLIEEMRHAAWSPTMTVGDGQEYRAELSGKFGSALLLDGSLVHGSVVGTLG